MGYRQGNICPNFSRGVLVESCHSGFINEAPFTVKNILVWMSVTLSYRPLQTDVTI